MNEPDNDLDMRHEPTGEEDVSHRAPVIGENTALRLGFVIALLGLTLGGLIVTIWWAATLTSDVNTIKTQLVKLGSIETMSQEIRFLTARVDSLEKRGSEPLQAMQKEMDRLAEQIRVHLMNERKP